MFPPFFYFCVCVLLHLKKKSCCHQTRERSIVKRVLKRREPLCSIENSRSSSSSSRPSSRPSWDEIPSVTLGFSTCLCPSFLSSSSSIRPKERELQQSIERLIIQPLYSFLFLIPYYYYDEIQAARNNGGNICFRMAASRPIYTDFHFLIVI